MAIFTITVPKAGKSYTYDSDKIPDVSLHYVTDYGFRQSMVDSTASITKDAFTKDGKVDVDAMRAAAVKLADQRDAQIRTGAVPGSRVAVDPLAVVASMHGITVDQLKKLIALNAAETATVESTPAPTTTLIKKQKTA